MTDLTAPSARSERDSLATRTDILDKVKVLSLLPDDMHATTEQVATYFEAPVETIKSVVKYNRNEIDSDGYRVVRGEELRLNFNPSSLGLNPRTPSLALFPRRAILRIGMLLRDSTVARQVRDHLLNVEADAVKPLSGLEYALALVDAERRAEAGAKFQRAIEGGDGIGLRVFHKKYFSAITEKAFFAHLYSKNYLIDQKGKGTRRESGPRKGTYRNGSQHSHPSYKGKPWLYLHTPKTMTGYRREETRVRPGRYELDFRDHLANEGLAANENTAGLFGLDGAIDKEIA
ncbi:hypothetical protein R4P64_07880 [Rhodococcus sp. IEGM 1366]|uniref:hypothetical protein n=1 Tax=Rhodococcus sp. IEGM 1366 TaxID=3082223 RepID=UPI002954FCB7|nr:hypothetical protein [Rhodococcus sp. IEGM 1366]MDV8066420.1 hypothetical protein [Rhodococcus sp. IEGM 1366]